jgi:hypothetical protein
MCSQFSTSKKRSSARMIWKSPQNVLAIFNLQETFEREGDLEVTAECARTLLRGERLSTYKKWSSVRVIWKSPQDVLPIFDLQGMFEREGDLGITAECALDPLLPREGFSTCEKWSSVRVIWKSPQSMLEIRCRAGNVCQLARNFLEREGDLEITAECARSPLLPRERLSTSSVRVI